MQKIKVALVGYNGKMGKLTQEVIQSMDGFEITSKISRNDNIDDILKSTKPDVAIELTSANSVFTNVESIIKNGVRPIIGSSGLNKQEIELFSSKCKEQKLGGLIIPNFSLGIALISNFIKSIPSEFDKRSIIEFHHKAKLDSPSGTSKYLADYARINYDQISSVRSDDFVAKHQLYISSEYERIIIDHESFDRKSFSLGISLSLQKIMSLDHMIIGLENII